MERSARRDARFLDLRALARVREDDVDEPGPAEERRVVAAADVDRLACLAVGPVDPDSLPLVELRLAAREGERYRV